MMTPLTNEDVHSCISCGDDYDVDHLTHVDGDMYCSACAPAAPMKEEADASCIHCDRRYLVEDIPPWGTRGTCPVCQQRMDEEN